MTSKEIETKLNESLSSGSKIGERVFEIKKDYRKLEARYICTATERNWLCVGFHPSHVGSCMAYQNGICTNSGVLNG